VNILFRAGFVMAIATLIGLAGAPAQAENSGLGLEISVSSQHYDPGDPVELTMTVTNRGTQPCQLVESATGTVHVLSVKRDGAPVSPSFGSGRFPVGIASSILAKRKTVPAGGSVTFDVVSAQSDRAVDSAMLHTDDPLAGGAGVAALWPVGRSGQYTVVVQYSVPAVGAADTKPCTGSSNVATTTFSVGDTGSNHRWILIIAGGALLVLLLVFVVWRIRRRGRVTAAAIIVLAAIMGTAVANVPQAGAELVPAMKKPKKWSDKKWEKWNNELGKCFGLYGDPSLGDPAGIMKVVTDPTNPGVYIVPSDGDTKSEGTPGAGTSIVWWNMDDRSVPDPDGVALDPCSSLYHELYHAERHMVHQDTDNDCGNTGILKDEVEATFAENAYRAKHFNGDKYQRKYYDGKKLPPNEGDCTPPAPTPKPKNACTATGGDTAPGLRGRQLLALNAEECESKSAETNGDPHLITFDQYAYDFQAVGEFVAARSGTDFEVQTRQSPIPNLDDRTVSVNSAVAIKVGADKVGLYMDNGDLAVHLNGRAEAIALGDKKLPGGGLLTRRKAFQEYKPDGYTVTWPDGSVAELDGIGTWGIRLILSPAMRHKGKLTGLLGNFDGSKDNELRTKDGTQIAQPPQYEQLYRSYGDSWRIAQPESLFDYGQGENTEKFTDRSFPERMRTVQDLPADQRDRAREACRLTGVTDPTLVDQCMMDVALTGQASFAINAGDTQDTRPATSTTPTPAPGRTIRDGDIVSGKLDAVGKQDVYQLDLGSATEFQFVDVTGHISIEPPPGRWHKALAVDAWRVADSSPEARQVIVTTTSNGSGEYRFRLVTQKPRRFEVKQGERISRSLDVPGRVDVYRINPGGATTLDLADTRGCGYWVGIAGDSPDGSVTTPYPVSPDEPGGPCSTLPMRFEPNKPFLLVVWSAEAKTSDYAFRISLS
jgi:hypothetical protein